MWTEAISFRRHRSVAADLFVLLAVGALLFGTTLYIGESKSAFNPSYEIDLSLQALPLYAFFSALRGLVAYGVSLAFTLVVGYWAAKSANAEKIILPVLDVLQSIPVLGFLPAAVLGLVALFPSSNVGLELAAVLMIFTGQVWNMTFAYYSSLKSIPGDLQEAASVMGLSPMTRLFRLELPFSAVNLAWNSIMSMAGGWFFLTVCEAFTLGEREYRLPGLGAYMAVATERADTGAVIAGIVAMALVIIILDILIWRPVLVWVHRFRLESSVAGAGDDRLASFVIAHSGIVRFLRAFFIQRRRHHLFKARRPLSTFHLPLPRWNPKGTRILVVFLIIAVVMIAVFGSWGLLKGLWLLPAHKWLDILEAAMWTFLRVTGALALSTLWALPAGIWLSMEPARMRVAQPIAQLLASFPAPMLYPLALSVLFALGLHFSVSAMVLMFLGVQWYVLFNVMAGGLRISREMADSMTLMGCDRRSLWRYLYIPSVFPALVTGWVTAAGGAWNASIVAELITYHGRPLETTGLGALISKSASTEDFQMLSASLVVMVGFVVLLNRFFWSRIYRLSQTRFRLDF